MKTLDDQVPSGYFEGLPNRTLARLGEESSMQTTTGNTSSAEDNTGVPPQRDEDSGLHDLRSMASSTKMRLSSRRITQPPALDDDVLASSSAGWKAVALPEPARMVSLPEIEPAAAEAPKSERKSKKEIKAERVSAKQIAAQAAVETSAPVAAAPVAAAPVKAADIATTPIIGARFQQQKKSKAGLYATIGMGLAAAAGVGWYVSTQMGSKEEKAAQVAVSTERSQQAPAATPEPQPVSTAGSAAVAAEPAPPADAVDTKVATGMAMEEKAAAAPAAADEAKPRGKGAKAKKDDKVVIDLDSGPKRPEAAKDKKVEEPKPDTQKKEGEGEPSFDALLKEAGVSQDKKPVQPKLEKKSLSSADIKTGMNAVAGKAQACYNGQQGTAQVKLTVAPDGTVQKVSVSGVFAGTPVGSCVESAVKGAKFPAWDGGPQSFGFSYLLAE